MSRRKPAPRRKPKKAAQPGRDQRIALASALLKISQVRGLLADTFNTIGEIESAIVVAGGVR